MMGPLLVLGAVAVGLAVFYVILPWIIAPLFRLILLPRYGFRVRGRENVPRRGPVVVIANHATWLDGFFLGAVFPRRGRALVNGGMLKNRFVRAFAVRSGLIPVPFSGPKAQRAAIQACRDALDQGMAVVIFPEGQLSRTGFLGPFYRGLELILRGRDDIPVVPAYIDNLWGSLWSFSEGRFGRKRPRGLRRIIGVNFGPPIAGPVDLFRLRQSLVEAAVPVVACRRKGADAVETIDLNLPHFSHPRFGLLIASSPDYEVDGIRQPGRREGTVGHPLPGVAIRAVNASGEALGPDEVGPLQAKVAGESDHWLDIGQRGSVDREGFVRIVSLDPAPQLVPDRR